MRKTKVAVLGATGMIGQRFVQMLENHPYFEIEGLYASERSAGKRFGDALKISDHEFSRNILDTELKALDTGRIADNCRIAFGGLPTEVAGPTETELAGKGVAVFTNAGSHRMDANVPVIIPEVNPEHFAAIRDQDTYGSGGFIVANANCPTTGIAAPMKALDSVFGVREIFVSTYQALSGAGYPGVPSLDILGNVIPYIANEEEKMERELNKIMGGYDRGFQPAPFALTASCARVPVAEGHLESVVVRTEDTPSADDVDEALSSFMGEPQRLSLPSAPEAPIIVRREEDRPQPKFDLMAGSPERARGMAVTVGRIKESRGYIKMFVFSHNTLRGGAGGSVLNAEFAYRTGLL